MAHKPALDLHGLVSAQQTHRGWAVNVHSLLYYLSPGPEGPDVLHCIGKIFNL